MSQKIQKPKLIITSTRKALANIASTSKRRVSEEEWLKIYSSSNGSTLEVNKEELTNLLFDIFSLTELLKKDYVSVPNYTHQYILSESKSKELYMIQDKDDDYTHLPSIKFISLVLDELNIAYGLDWDVRSANDFYKGVISVNENPILTSEFYNEFGCKHEYNSNCQLKNFSLNSVNDAQDFIENILSPAISKGYIVLKPKP